MTARAAARLLYAAGLIAPALALVPWRSGVLAAATAAALLAASMHGWGRLVARVAGCRLDAPLAIALGLAALVALGGALVALGRGDALGFRALVLGGALLHVVRSIRIARGAVTALAEVLARPGAATALVPLALAAGLGGLAILGAAGDPVGDRPYDDDAHVLGQLRELADTGGLGDPLGYARVHQLGGHVVVAGLGTLGVPHGGLALARLVDAGLAFALVLALVLARLRPADGARALWGALLIVALSALAVTTPPATPGWTITLLVLALAVLLDEHRAADATVPIGLLAGALVTLRHELAPVAAVTVLAGWWLRRRAVRQDAGRIGRLLASVACAVLPLALARAAAWTAAPEARAVLVAARGSLPVQLGVFAGVTAVAGGLVVALVPPRRRWIALACVAGVAGTVSQLAGDRPFATRFVAPVLVAGAVLLVIDLAGHARLRLAGLVVALLACVVIHEGREASGRRRWNRRLAAQAQALEHLRTHGLAVPAAASLGYEAALAQIPAGARVAISVGQPEALDRRRHRVLDLRTPRGVRLRQTASARASRADALLRAAGADFLLLEDDHRALARARRSPEARARCATSPEACADDLERLTGRHPTRTVAPGLRLVELRRSDRAP